MSQLHANQIFDHPSWRRIISQFRGIFNSLHNHIESGYKEDINKTQNLNLSEICSLANQNYINVLENELKLLSEKDKSIEETIKLILKIWKLCQIIFIKSSPAGTLLVDLQNWYRSTNNIDPMIQEIFSTNSNSVKDIYKDEKYWILILISVAQGRIDTARHLLSFHPLKNYNVFKVIDEQLRIMPNFETLGHFSLFEFKAKWEYWQRKCIQILANENFQIEETGYLEIICKMLCADEKTFYDLKPIFNNWYYMLISYISYLNPTFNISDLHALLEFRKCMKCFENELEEFDAIIYSIFDFDVHVVINECVELFSNNLFSAHLLDILYLNGKLQINKSEFNSNLKNNEMINQANRLNNENIFLFHEQHLTEYALQLLSATWSSNSISLYQTAFDYLIICKNIENSGLKLIEIYFEKVTLSYLSESDAYKIFNLAFQYNMHDLAFSIGRVMQSRAIKRGLYGTALCWNTRIKDNSFGNYLAEQILDQFFKNKDYRLLELTESFSNDIIYSDRLLFLSKYREFHKLLDFSSKTNFDKNESLKNAGTLISHLFVAPKLIPYKYIERILSDFSSLIHKNVFNEEQLFNILRIIQMFQNYENIENYSNEDFEKKVSKELFVEIAKQIGDKLVKKHI